MRNDEETFASYADCRAGACPPHLVKVWLKLINGMTKRIPERRPIAKDVCCI